MGPRIDPCGSLALHYESRTRVACVTQPQKSA